MFCTNCGKEDESLNLKSPICKNCSFDNSYVLQLVAEDHDEDEDLEDEFRTALTCARRCVVLFGVVSAGHGENRKKIVNWLKEESLWEFVSENEKVFLEAQAPSEQQMIDATWRIEALSVLAWALQKIPSISNFRAPCEVNEIKAACSFYLGSTKEFLGTSELRSEDEIYDVNEMNYDSHWKVRDAQIHRRPVPDGIISSVVQERHHAINWLMGYCGQEWDEVTTDT